MILGIEAKEFGKKEKTGVDVFLENLVLAIAKIDTKDQVVLYSERRISLSLPQNFKLKKIRFPFMWRFLGLSFYFLFFKKPDILLFPAQVVPFFYPAKKAVVIHDLAFLKFPQTFTLKDRLRLTFLTWWAAKRADVIIVPSVSTKKDIVKIWSKNSKKIFVVPHGFDKKLFYPRSPAEVQKVLKKYQIQKPYLLFVGSLQPRKNVIRLVLAFERLKKEGLPHKLVIIGGKGWLSEKIVKKIKNSQFSKEIFWLGYVKNSDLPFFYSGADLFVLPSLYEGFGLPILEASACKTAVVASNVSSMPEILKESALYFNPRSVLDIARTIKRALSQKEILAQKAYQKAQNFSWVKSAQKILKILKK